MKDGNVCIWSGFHLGPPMHARFSNISQLCIQLRPVSRDGPNAAKVHCDGVAWTCDDMKVITSQSSPTKASSTDIIPDSHMIYVWDSDSGKCLMGIISSHSSLCSALAPHPHLSSVVASAGSDGVVNVWDLDRGDCFFTHGNNLLHGPVEPATNRGKRCGYLEVQFSPDGLKLVLTDESGRITILDTQVSARLRTESDNAQESYSMTARPMLTPSWMKEQYFANDYYELVYDANGYCIERGSQQPPHLAPGGVRCTHEGIAYPEVMRATYREIQGPLPVPPSIARWNRDNIRSRSTQVELEGGVVSKNAPKKIKRILGNPDIFQRCKTTAIITKEGKLVQHERQNMPLTNSSYRVPGASGNRNSSNSTSVGRRQLSNRYRWIDYNDLPESEDENEDQDDEEYLSNGRRLEESSEEDDYGGNFLSEPHGRQQSGRERGRSGRSRHVESPASDDEFHEQRQPARASSRQTAQRSSSSRQAAQRIYHELNSDDEALEELMSTHTKPSGKFVEDWDVSKHIFKLPRGEGSHVRRNWLCRTIHEQRKKYCPQVGDSVVYIPRAHSDTLKNFPVNSYSEPWKSWPKSSSWPVVRCTITHARYRFPYETYYKSRSPDEKIQDVVAILTLEISGVPSRASGRTFPWPAPTFVSPTASRTRSNDSIQFEVTLFESTQDDFLIPEYLYSWRVKELERAIAENDGKVDGLEVTVHCPPDRDDNCLNADDQPFNAYDARLTHIHETGEDEFHFMDSGYNALSLNWEVDEGSEDTGAMILFSVWNVSMTNRLCHVPVAPTMGEDVTKAVRAAVSTIVKLDPNVNEWFFNQVDITKYTDYMDMIEVPMYLSKIQVRLRSKYYTNKLSVIADMELVKENCYKYNEDGDDIFELACQMYDKFKSLVDDIEENQTTGIEVSAEGAVNNQQHGVEWGNEETPDSLPIAHDAARANAGACATQTGSSKESDISDGEDILKTQSKAQSSCQPTSNKGQGEGIMTDIESEHEEIAQHRTRRSAAQKLQPAEAGSPCRRTSSRARTKPIYAEKDSEEDEHSESSGGDESDGSDDEVSVEEETSLKKGRTMPSRARSKPGYAEKGSEEEDYSESSDEDESDGSDDEVSSEEEVSHKKRKRGCRTDEPRKKRCRTQGQKKGFHNYPDLERWHPVSRRQIARVGVAVLGKLRERDTMDLFSQPVLEAYPGIAEEYLRAVKKPMDFRTIEDELLSTYEHISELQDDLILTFRNCCVYNGEMSEYYNYAIKIWQSLNDVFNEVALKNY
ncbi:hypothetical protein ACHAXR_010002 [Thalassiosira sp. AJA248-18]